MRPGLDYLHRGGMVSINKGKQVEKGYEIPGEKQICLEGAITVTKIAITGLIGVN